MQPESVPIIIDHLTLNEIGWIIFGLLASALVSAVAVYQGGCLIL